MPDPFFAAPPKPKKRKRTDSEGPGTRRHNNAPSKPTKFAKKSSSLGRKPPPPPSRRKDEELSDQTDDDDDAGGLDDMDLRADDVDPNASGAEDEDAHETPAEKRLRLAQLYLESVKVGLAEGEFDAAEIDKELIQARLKQDVLEHSGKVHLFIADAFDFTQPPTATLRTRGHRLAVTSAVVSESGSHLFTAGKEGHILQWDLRTGKQLASLFKLRPPSSQDRKGKGKAKATAPDAGVVRGHTDEVLALAVSGDGRYLASAGRDRRVCVWDAHKAEWLTSFFGHLGHKDAVGVLAFKKGTNQLYSGSFDRTLKVYDLSPSVLGYVETLFGHQDGVLALDALRGDTCVSVGARDKTVRYWKIVDETQLVFRGGGRSRVREVLEGGLRGDEEGEEGGGEEEGGKKGRERESRFVEGSLESVAMVDETTFVSGGDSGSICLWNTLKKKPIFTQPLAHGFNEVLSESAPDGVVKTPRWITALACLRYSDIFASGSWDGDVKLWKLDAALRSFSLVGRVAVPGVINSLQLLGVTREFVENASAAWSSSSSLPLDAEAGIVPPPPPTTARETETGTEKKGAKKTAKKEVPVNPFVLVAGVGQEHRFGRWVKVKEGGARNGAVVCVFRPRTLLG